MHVKIMNVNILWGLVYRNAGCLICLRVGTITEYIICSNLPRKLLSTQLSLSVPLFMIRQLPHKALNNIEVIRTRAYQFNPDPTKQAAAKKEESPLLL